MEDPRDNPVQLKKTPGLIEQLEKLIDCYRELQDRQQAFTDNMLGSRPLDDSKGKDDSPSPLGFMGKIETQLETLHAIGTEMGETICRLEEIA